MSFLKVLEFIQVGEIMLFGVGIDGLLGGK